MEEKVRMANEKRKDKNKEPKVCPPCKFVAGKPCGSCKISKTNCSLTLKTEDGVTIRRKIRNRTIVQYVIKATEQALEEFTIEKQEREAKLKKGKKKASTLPAKKRQARRAGKQRATSELLPDLPSAPTQQSELPGTQSAIGMLSHMTLQGASSSSDLS
jgi:hypothetical protein